MRIDMSEDNTADILKDIELAIRKALTESGLRVEGEMKNRAPVAEIKGSNLRKSINYNLGKDSEGHFVDIGPTAEYAAFVEYGTGIHVAGGRQTPWTYYSDKLNRFVTTSGMEAQEFAKPGFDAARPKVDAIMERELKV